MSGLERVNSNNSICWLDREDSVDVSRLSGARAVFEDFPDHCQNASDMRGPVAEDLKPIVELSFLILGTTLAIAAPIYQQARAERVQRLGEREAIASDKNVYEAMRLRFNKIVVDYNAKPVPQRTNADLALVDNRRTQLQEKFDEVNERINKFNRTYPGFRMETW